MDIDTFFKKSKSYKIKKVNFYDSNTNRKSRNQHKSPKQDTEENFLSTLKNISENKIIFSSLLKRCISQSPNGSSDKSSSFLIKNQLQKNKKDNHLQDDKKSIKTICAKTPKNKKHKRRSISNDFERIQNNLYDLSNKNILNRTKSNKTNKVNKNFIRRENSKGSKKTKKLILSLKNKSKDNISNNGAKNIYEIFSPLSDNRNFKYMFKKKEKNYKNSSSSKVKNIKNIANSSKEYKNFVGRKRSNSLKSTDIINNSYNFPFFFNFGNQKVSKKQMNSSTLISNILKDNCNRIKDNSFNNNFLKHKNKSNILNDKIFDFKKSKNKDNKLSSRLLNSSNKKLNNNNQGRKKFKTIILADTLNQNNLLAILRTNKPIETKMNNTGKIMDLFAMDELNKKLKESLISINKTELKRELKELETNEICKAIDNLPINKNSNIETGDLNALNIKNKENKKFEFEDTIIKTSKTKLDIFNERFRILKHKTMIYDSLDDEEIEDVETNSVYISPDSFLVYLIDTIILICSFIELFYLPIYIAKKPHFCRNIFNFNEIMFYCIDFFYIVDLITEFFRAYYNFDEFLIKKNSAICKKYLNSWFFTDFIESIPIYIIINRFENKCDLSSVYRLNHFDLNINKLHYTFLIFKILKIFKVFSKNTVLNKLIKIANDTEFLFQSKTVLFTILIFISSLNIISCLFIFFGRNSYPSWIIEFDMQNNSFIQIYVTAIYYIITTVTTVGYGDITITSLNERIFQLLILIVGTCAYSWTITYISNIIQKNQEKYIDYENKISILKEIKISNPYLSEKLYNKIFRYLQYNRSDQKNENEIIINCLPYPLKNTLFMEMYKPIIKNFNIFKSFENSNFIVKVVTSFKPVLSVEGDILLQEGDFVEDIIFVKEGIISLEICVDLENPQEYIEDYLKETGFGKSNHNVKMHGSTVTNSHITYKNSFSSTNIKNNIDDENENHSDYSNRGEFKKNKKYLKIIDIRKNEHFGDILMFLNERAPFRIKVKSKKAEIYLLNKTDAIEISTLFSNIWKRIMKKSLFNMKQIRNLSRKMLIIFAQRNGLILNENIYNKIDKTITLASKLNEDNTDLSKTNDDSEKNNCDDSYNSFSEKNEKQPSRKKKIINTIIYEEDENNESLATTLINKNDKNFNMFKNQLYKKCNSSNSKYSDSSLQNNNCDSKITTSLFKKSKNKASKKSVKFSQSDELKITDGSVDISVQNNERKISDNLINNEKCNSLPIINKNKTIPKENEKNDNFGKDDGCKSGNAVKIKGDESNININDPDDFDFLNPTPFKKEEINCEIYPNELFNQDHFLKIEQRSPIQSPEKFTDKNKEKNFNNKNILKFIGKQKLKYSLNSSNKIDLMNIIDSPINSQNEKESFEQNSNNNSVNSIKDKNEKFINVCCSSEISGKNGCQIFKQQNNNLKKYFDNLSITNIFSTTINSSYENINQMTKYQFSKDPDLQQKMFKFINEEYLHNTDSSNNSNIDPLTRHNLYMNNKKKKNSNSLFFTPEIKSRRSRKDNEIINKDEKIDSPFIANIKKRISKSPKKDRNKLMHINSSSPYIPKRPRNGSVIIRPSNTSFSLHHNKEKKCCERRITKNNTNKFEENELNFYGKMKTLRGGNIKNINQNNIKAHKKKSYMDLISNNILQNKQTLKNPEEFYTDLFTDLVQKKKIITKKANKPKNNCKTNLSNTRIHEDNIFRSKNRLRNHDSSINLSNFDNSKNLRRNSTSKGPLSYSHIKLQ